MSERTVDLEYIGDPPILDDLARYRIATGQIDKRGAAVLRDAEDMRLKAIKGITIRHVEQEHFGTSRDYTFGPTEFVLTVSYEDYEKIMESESAHQFRLHSDAVEIVRPELDILMDDAVEGGFREVFSVR